MRGSQFCTRHIVMFYITVMYHHNIPNGIQVIDRTRKCLRMDIHTDGQTTDGRQVHCYIPRTYRLGIKKQTSFDFEI